MPMNDSVVIDTDALGRLEEWGGQDLILKMLQLFLEHAPERMDQIRTGIDGESLEVAERGAHSLKSSAGNLGARRLQSLAAEVEDLAAGGDAEGVLARLPDLETAYAEARAALSDVADSISGT